MAPMRILDQQIMNRVFAVTDEIPLSRESVQVALVLEGEGTVERTAAVPTAVETSKLAGWSTGATTVRNSPSANVSCALCRDPFAFV